MSKLIDSFDRSPSASALAPALTHVRSSRSVVHEPDELNIASARRSVKCVLLSDDRPFCVLVRSYLQHLGFCVFTCTSSDRAEQQFLDRHDIDLWVVDVEALGAEAMYLAARVRSRHAKLPIVVISEAGHDATAARAFPWHAGWIGIKKPVQLPELLAIIQRALAHCPAALHWASSAGRDLEPHENDRLNKIRQNHLMN